jgi:hypothetical protein
MDTEFLKINKQCFQNILEATNALANIETKGESTMLIYKIRVTLLASLEQMQKDNQEQPAIIDNTQQNINPKKGG